MAKDKRQLEEMEDEEVLKKLFPRKVVRQVKETESDRPKKPVKRRKKKGSG
jgi:hypothetical protein